MKTYADIKAEIAKLERQAEAVLNQERAGVISRIKEAVKVYGFTAQELGFGANSKASSQRSAASTQRKATATATTVGVAKYRDPQTGKTWTGRGKPPNWIVGAKDRDAFLIRPGTDVRTPAAQPKGGAAAPDGARGPRQSTARGGRRRNAAKKVSASERQAAPAPAVQVESGAASA